MKFFQFLEKALSESNGEPSGMRVKVFYIVICIISVVSYGFVYVAHHYPDLIIMYLTTIVGLVAAALGIKGWQKGKEEAKPEGKTE